MKRRPREEDGFENWGGYMDAKKSKLIQQFNEDKEKFVSKVNDLLKGIAIFVNGYTNPTAEELRTLMMKHGGAYHHYYKSGSTTHIIASNLPDSKLKLTNNHKIVKPSWITDSIKAKKVLNYADYQLYNNQTKKQPSLKNVLNCKNEPQNSTRAKDATHEGFLSEFYGNSRLHHISTMGAIFKDFINTIRSDKNHKLSGKDEILNTSKSMRNNYSWVTTSHQENKIIMHIDMDCFFVSVGLRNKPELRGLPVAVTHSRGNKAKVRNGVNTQNEILAYRKKLEISGKNTNIQKSAEHWSNYINELDSFAEIASCSYEARKAGIKNGMFVGQALKLCPNLKFIHYDFESYKEVSFILYKTITRYTLDVEAVSCDEMYADCTELLKSVLMNPIDFANILRAEIKNKTGCPCSVGFGGNRLQARLATKKAKPDGQFYLTEEEVSSFMYNLPVSELPGVGGSTKFKLKSMGIITCGDLQNTSLSRVQGELGKKLGETLHKNSFGKDDKPLMYTHVRKSVSADINYGIRFQNDTERDNFLKQLSEEVASRLISIKMKGRSITLKLMVRSKDAPEETSKYLGHGVCDQISKGISLPVAVSSASIIYREVLKIINNINVNSKDLRGIGIQISRLEDEVPADNKIMHFLTSNKKNEVTSNSNKQIKESNQTKNSSSRTVNTYGDLSLSQIDQSFLDALPEDIQTEIINNIKSNKTGKNLKENMLNQPHQSNHYVMKKDNNLQEKTEILEKENEKDEMKTYISPNELRMLIKQWVETEMEPQNRDVLMIMEYLRHLIAAGHLEELLIIIKSFYRYISRNKKSISWKQAYMEIVGNIQNCIKEKYNSSLIIEDTFSI